MVFKHLLLKKVYSLETKNDEVFVLSSKCTCGVGKLN